VESHARVTRVLFEGDRAVGVSYTRDGHPHEAWVEREVILSAGTIGSAKLLLLSGIGPADELAELGLPVVRDLPGVGKNLQDHPRVALTYVSRKPLGLSDTEREQAEQEYEEHRTGPLSSNGVGAGVFARLSPDEPAPSLQIMLTANPPAGSYSVHTVLAHPRSRGWLRLQTADPEDPPLIQANYLADERDLEGLLGGLEIARRIAAADSLAEFRGEELGPGSGNWGDEALRDYVRENVVTFFHPVGTCRMGNDENAVVDAELRVRGVRGLRVIDASVIPTLLNGATHAATVMIAEKGADLLK
jgi:choline dehydrogenase